VDYKFQHVIDKVFPAYFRDVAKIQSSEANYASLLYMHLVHSGFGPGQICTEMYTANLVKEGTRPDLVIFDEGIQGRFNYYKDCDKRQSNTQVKLDNLKCVVEIKGGSQQHESGLGKYFRHDPLCKALLNDPITRKKTQNCALAIDVEKLGMWSSHFGDAGEGRDYVFLAIDMKNPKGFWPDNIRDEFGGYCKKHKVNLIYYAQGSKHFWHYPLATHPSQIPLAQD